MQSSEKYKSEYPSNDCLASEETLLKVRMLVCFQYVNDIWKRLKNVVY